MLPINELSRLEYQWLDHERGKEPDPDLWGWSPLDMKLFTPMADIAAEAAKTADRNRITFFEPGCGIGTKLYYMQEYLGLIAHGWDIAPEYVAQAHKLGVSAELKDLRWNDPHYEEWDIVYTSRQYKDDDANSGFENQVRDAMRPGAIYIGAFLGTKPYEWECLDRGPWRGVWRKPHAD